LDGQVNSREAAIIVVRENCHAALVVPDPMKMAAGAYMIATIGPNSDLLLVFPVNLLCDLN
jgi:hypothetical protein